ncbi:hypothetical protein Tco_0728623 [Tanacetum coccineum]|uniref:Uncharacterized protein n=1 Tax=Tanacetum coccineum TaxID=301880 RepID=A0ABQ4YPB1_9ASTR
MVQGHSVEKDPLPSDDIIDLNLMGRLNEGRAAIRMYHGAFLFMWLFDSIKSSDPFKVKIGERTLVDREVSLSKEMDDMVIFPSRDIIQIVDHTIVDEMKVTSRKKKKWVSFNENLSPVKKVRRSSFPATPKKDLTTGARPWLSFKSLLLKILKRVLGSTQGGNVRTRPAAERFVVISSSSPSTEHANTKPSFLKSASPQPHVQTKAVVVTFAPVNEMGASSALDVINDFHLNDVVRYQNFIDHAPPLGYWASLRNLTNSDFLDQDNINTAQQTCMVSELRIKYEHEIEARERFEKKFVKTTAAARVNELADLGAKNVELLGQVSGIEFLCDGLKGQVSELEVACEGLKGEIKGEAKMREEFIAFQDAGSQRIEKQNAELDTRLTELNFDMDTDLYPYMMTVITGRRWMIGHSLCLAVMKCIQSYENQAALRKAISLAIYHTPPKQKRKA